MRVKPEQLKAHLQKALAPVYLLTGDEPLQIAEAADEIRLAAKQADYLTREVISIDKGTEWQQLTEEASALSIFSENKLIDLRWPSAKPGLEGSKVICQYCQNPPENTLLLITTDKIDKASQKSLWFQALDNLGVIVQVWPLQGADLLQWLRHRASKRGLHCADDALKLLAAKIEGNLLAAAQEIEKLYILHGNQYLTKEHIEAAVANSSRFDVYNLSDELLAGNLNRATHMLNALKAEGIAAPVVLWALSRDARLLISLKQELKQGGHQESVFKKHQIWDKRKALVQQALTRLKMADLFAILALSAKTDQQIKGQLAGDSWESLFTLCVYFVSGKNSALSALSPL